MGEAPIGQTLDEPLWPDLARRKEGFRVRTFFTIRVPPTPVGGVVVGVGDDGPAGVTRRQRAVARGMDAVLGE